MSAAWAPKRLQTVFVAARRPAELHAFYEGALGLLLKFRDGERWIQYGVGNANVALASPQEAAPAMSGCVMVLEVDALDGAAQRIAAAGGQVLGVRDMDTHGTVLSLRDPEGNLLQLFTRATSRP